MLDPVTGLEVEGDAPERVADAREEAGFLSKEKLASLDDETRARVIALARENAGLRSQNDKLIGRITTQPVAPASGNGHGTKPPAMEERIRDEAEFPSDDLSEYVANASDTLAALRVADPESPKYEALKAEASKIDQKVLKLARRELIRREAVGAVKPEFDKVKSENAADQIGRSLFAPTIEKWGESALSDENSELMKAAVPYYHQRLAMFGGPDNVPKQYQMAFLQWAVESAEKDLARAGVTPIRSRGRLEDMGGAGGGGSAQSGSAAQVANQVLSLHKQGKSAEAHKLDLQRMLEDRNYRPVFGRS